MKNVISALIIFVFANILFAAPETVVRIYMNDGSPTQYFNINDIDKMGFKNLSNQYVMKFHYQDSLTSSYPVTTIDSVKFNVDTNNVKFVSAYVFGAPKSFPLAEIDSIIFKQIETIIAENVVVIDSLESNKIIYIDSSSIIIDSTSNLARNLVVGEIIVAGPSVKAPNGFIRNVLLLSFQGDSIIIQTNNAKITDVIKSGIISFTKKFLPQDTIPGKMDKNTEQLQADEGFTVGFEDIVVYDYDSNPGTENDQIRIDGSNTFTPDIGFNLEIENGEIKQLLFQIMLRNKLGLTAHATIEEEKSIKKSVNSLLGIPAIRLPVIVIPVGPCPLCIPITITSNIDLQIGIELKVGAEVSTSVTVENTAVAGIEYNSGNWKLISDYTSGFKFEPPKLSIGGSLKAFLGPQLNMNFFNLQSAFNAYAGVFGFAELEIQLLEKPLWQLWSGLEAKAGVESEWWPVLDYDSPFLIESRDLLAKSTNLIDTILPLNAKVGDTLTILGNDVFGLTRGVNGIKFKFGKSLLPVDCILATEFPLWNPDTIKVVIPQGITGDSVQILLDLGGFFSNQYAYKLKRECTGLSSYSNVTIGTQIWMGENLDVCFYRNGDTIRFAESNEDWFDAGNKQEGAWCYYDNDPENGKIYGKLYNWYAVDDSRGLAPSGYHVPSDAEWSTLNNYLSNNSQYWCENKSLNIGKSLAANEKWNYHYMTCSIGNDINTNNSTGFSALPSGYRHYTGEEYNAIGLYGYGWSSTQTLDIITAFMRGLTFQDVIFFRSQTFKDTGLSVRCIKD